MIHLQVFHNNGNTPMYITIITMSSLYHVHMIPKTISYNTCQNVLFHKMYVFGKTAVRSLPYERNGDLEDFTLLLLLYETGGGGGIRLIVGFQPLMVISPTASWIRWCMRVS